MNSPTRLVLTELLNRQISELFFGRGGKKAAGEDRCSSQ